MSKWGCLWRWSSVPGQVNHPAVSLQTNGTVTVIEPLLHFGRNTPIAACKSPNAYLHMHSSASHDACTPPRQIFSEMSSEWTVAKQTLHVAPTINTFFAKAMRANPSTIYRRTFFTPAPSQRSGQVTTLRAEVILVCTFAPRCSFHSVSFHATSLTVLKIAASDNGFES